MTDAPPTIPQGHEPSPGDDLVTVITCATEFEAATKVAVLQDAGIESFAFAAAHAALPLQARFLQVPVQVRAADLERARAMLEETRKDAPRIDWDSVDVGEREDDLPLRTPGRMPWPVRVGFALALLVLITMLVGLAWSALLAMLAWS